MKKHKTIFLLLISCATVIHSQNEIPNASFENWESGSPVSWFSTNTSFTTNITEYSDAQDGNKALRGEIINFSGIAYFPSVRAVDGPLAQPFPISQNYSSVKGFFQYFPSQTGLDMWFSVIVDFSNDDGPVARGGLQITNEETSTWTAFDVALDYSVGNGGNATKATVQITIGGDDDGRPPSDFWGTYFLVDNVSFDGVTSVNENQGSIPENFELEQNFPNPFNPETVISFSLPEASQVNMDIYNMLGQHVAKLVNSEMAAGKHNVTWNATNRFSNNIRITSGTYIYKLKAGNFSEVKKMLLLK